MNIIFVCHGNICRSIAAEIIFKHKCSFHNVISRATSLEEIGNGIYPPMAKELLLNGYNIISHHAKQITKAEHDWADMIFYMDKTNKYYLDRMFPNSKKIYPIFEYTNSIDSIEDPWYTGNYNKVIQQISCCVDNILTNISQK